jgi:hypothetical protein
MAQARSETSILIPDDARRASARQHHPNEMMQGPEALATVTA